MTDIDDDVRSLLAAAAEQITMEGVPPLRLPRAAAGDRPRFGVRRWPGWLGPVAAAVSVGVIAVAALVVSNAVAGRPRPVSPAGQPVPPYYIAITKPAGGAAIHATRTGALLARVVPPGRARPVIGLTAAADDRTFAIAVPAGRHGNRLPAPTRFYLVRFDPAGPAVRITPIPALAVPAKMLLAGFALSPSGAKLAVAYIGDAGPKYASTLKITDLATGAVRTWASPRGEFLRSGNPLDLSWADDNTTLAFNWFGFTLTPQRQLPTSGLWLLDTAKAGGGLIADSRRALDFTPGTPSFAVKGGYLVSDPVLAPDGKTIVAAIASKPLAGPGYAWFAKYDAASGRLERVFDRTLVSRTSPSPAMTVLWTSAFGSRLLVSEPPGFNGKLGLVRRSGHVTVLPGDRKQFLLPGPAW